MSLKDGITRRGLIQGMGGFGLLALFRPRFNPSLLVELPEEISEEDIIEEYHTNPAAIDMTSMVQMAFRPQRIIVPQNIAHLWVIENIIIGNASQIAEIGVSLPAEAFSLNAIDNDVLMDAIVPGMEFKMRVRRSGPVNLKNPPEIFQAAIMGHSIEGERRRQMILPISSNPFQVI